MKAYLLETVRCNFCGSGRHSVYIKGARERYIGLDEFFDVVECADCGFRFTNPRPTRETMGYFYPDSAGYYQPKMPRPPSAIRTAVERSVLASHYGYPFKRLPRYIDVPASVLYRLKRKFEFAHVPFFVEGGRLLEVGCSWGEYLHKMRALGWRVFGTDINRKSVQFAVDRLDIPSVRCGGIDDLDFEEGFFDVVRLGMVLEHLHDPMGALSRLHGLLKEDGVLILSVPDISGFEMRLFKDRAYALHVPQHLSHFTPSTLRRFLEKAGFSVERLLHHREETDMIRSAGYLENRLLLTVLNNKLTRKALVRPLIRALSVTGKTSRMTIFSRKTAPGRRARTP